MTPTQDYLEKCHQLAETIAKAGEAHHSGCRMVFKKLYCLEECMKK